MQFPLKRILVPVDGSEGAHAAARFAAMLADCNKASLTLLHVYDSAVIALMGFSTVSGKELDDAIDRVSRAHLDAARTVVDEFPIEVQCLVRVGDPAHEIVSCADTEAFDLIVIGSRGMSSLRQFLMGSVGAKVARHAHCSVTIVR